LVSGLFCQTWFGSAKVAEINDPTMREAHFFDRIEAFPRLLAESPAAIAANRFVRDPTPSSEACMEKPLPFGIQSVA
jgi:hypothetical protein